MKAKTPFELVREDYPQSEAVKIDGKQLYYVVNEHVVLGQGQTAEAAWKAAYRNIFDHR